jgi:hypothetical protein
MEREEARKMRPDLTDAGKVRLEKYGSLTFKSLRWPDCGARFIPRTQH